MLGFLFKERSVIALERFLANFGASRPKGAKGNSYKLALIGECIDTMQDLLVKHSMDDKAQLSSACKEAIRLVGHIFSHEMSQRLNLNNVDVQFYLYSRLPRPVDIDAQLYLFSSPPQPANIDPIEIIQRCRAQVAQLEDTDPGLLHQLTASAGALLSDDKQTRATALGKLIEFIQQA